MKIKVCDTHAFTVYFDLQCKPCVYYVENSSVRQVPCPSLRDFRDYTDLVSYVTPDWYFSSAVRILFVVRAYPTMRARFCLLNMSSVFEWYVWKYYALICE